MMLGGGQRVSGQDVSGQQIRFGGGTQDAKERVFVTHRQTADGPSAYPRDGRAEHS